MLWEKISPAVRAEMAEQKKRIAEWIDGVKAGVAEIAVTKSFQQFGREEEKE